MAATLGMLTGLPFAAPGQAPCSTAFTDSLSQRSLAAFERVATVAPVWDDYSLAAHPLLLIADSSFRGARGTPVCAAIWRQGRPLERIELAAVPPFSTPMYGMIDSDPVGPQATAGSADLGVIRHPAPPAVVDALRQRGITRVVVFHVPMRLETMGRLGEMLRNANIDPVGIQADLAVHESFHLHSQFPAWLDQPRTYAWPAWDVQPDRVAVRERCYDGSPALREALDAERMALLDAFDAVALESSNVDRVAGVRHARRFVALRHARRTLQDTMTIAQGARRIDCGTAEDVMELEEGTTQWLGHATRVRAGLVTMATLRASYAGTQPEVFYQIGPLQLWVLSGLLGNEPVRAITSAIARSAGPDSGLFAQFDHHTRRLTDTGAAPR